MDKLFLQILNMSLTAGYVILFVMLARLILKKAPKIFSYVLWIAVLFRLVCPFSFKSIFSLIPSAETIQPQLIDQNTLSISSGIAAIDLPVNDYFRGNYSEGVTVAEGTMRNAALIFSVIWLAGIAVLLLYSVISLLRLHSTLVGSVKYKGNIYFADRIVSPFVLGIIRPKIYLPSALSAEEQDYVLLHEQTHIKRFDHIFKLVMFFAVAVHWFNPLAWLAYVLFTKDMEMSCDESVMKNMNTDIRTKYSASLLSLATGKKIISAAPLAFGEGNTTKRIKNVMNYKKPALWIIIIAVIAVGIIGIALAANPIDSDENLDTDGASPSVSELYFPDVPDTVLAYANDYISREIVYYENDCGYKITDGKITSLSAISTGTAGLKHSVIMWLLEYRLLPENPSGVMLVGGMRTDGDWITEWGSAGQPLIVVAAYSGDDTWVRVGTTNTLTVLEEFNGDYTAATMAMFNKFNSEMGAAFSAQPVKELDLHFADVQKAYAEINADNITVQDSGDYEKVALDWMNAWLDVYKALPEDSVAYLADSTIDDLTVKYVSKEGVPKSFVFSVYFSVRPTYPIDQNSYWMAGNTVADSSRDYTWGCMYREVVLELTDGLYGLGGMGTGGVGLGDGYVVFN